MKKTLFLLSSIGLLSAPLRAQLLDPAQTDEKLALTHSDSGIPATPHHFTFDFHDVTGRTYVVEEVEDLVLMRWRRLPLLMLGNESWETTSGMPPLVYSSTNANGTDNANHITTSPNPFQFDASGDRQFVRLRYVEDMLVPFSSDTDRDGVSNQDEVTGYQTDPFAYPDDDTTTTDGDSLPDAWERYRLGTTSHTGTDTNAAGQSYADLYALDKRDTDNDGLPDDWERFRCGGVLTEDATTTHGPKTNLVRFREDRVKLTVHRFGAQEFRYDANYTTNALSSTPTDPLKVFLRGSEGGSMIVTYSDSTYSDITNVRVYPSNDRYGDPIDEVDLATHYANYAGSISDGKRVYEYSANPSSGSYVARDLLRSLDGWPLERITLSGSPRLRRAPFAITSLPVTSVDPDHFPIVLRDFPYGSPVFPEFGGSAYLLRPSDSGTMAYDLLTFRLDPDPVTGLPRPLAGLPRLSDTFYTAHPGDSGRRFSTWYSHPDAFGFQLTRQTDPFESDFSGYDNTADFFPHQNDVGTKRADGANRLGFTTELHLRLDYESLDTMLYFTSDDDMWVYIDGYLAVDQGGRHASSDIFTYKTLAQIRQAVKDHEGETTSFLESSSGSCLVDIFHAERQDGAAGLFFESDGNLLPIYAYQVVTDADLPTQLTYTLTQNPSGMTIDAHTGRILWDYLAVNRDSDSGNDVASGTYSVTVSVSDSRGYTATQSFTVTLQLPSP